MFIEKEEKVEIKAEVDEIVWNIKAPKDCIDELLKQEERISLSGVLSGDTSMTNMEYYYHRGNKRFFRNDTALFLRLPKYPF